MTAIKNDNIVRVADYIASFLHEKGVDDVFLLSGGGMMHLTDGLACNEHMNVTCLLHEQAASMAVDAYGRLTGNLGVGYFTTGPGATNAITGLAGAWLDSSPCLFISGQVKRKDTIFKAKIPGIRQIGVQEINIIPMIESITKYSAFIDDPEDIRYHLEKAVYMAKEGRPGPSWLDIPLDVQAAPIDPEKLKGFEPPKKENNISSGSIQKVVEYIKSASRPVILAGQGVRISGAINSLLELVEEYHIPVVTTYLGVDVIESNHPQYVGRIGIKGDRAGNLAVQNSDLLLIMGTSLPVAETNYNYEEFAREAKIIIVDIDISSHKKESIRTDLLIEGDAKEFIDLIYDHLSNLTVSFDENWLETCISWRERYPVCLPEYGELKDKINIYHFFDQLSKRLGHEDVVVTDAGSSFFVGSQSVKINKGVRYITSGGFATMGYGLPASIGISVALGYKRVMCVTGDGSFQQNIQEIQTVLYNHLPLKIFVLNNYGYNSMRFTQTTYFNGRLIGADPTSGVGIPDSGKIAKAYGIPFLKAGNNRELVTVLDEVLNNEGPVLCDIVNPPNQLVIPTVSSKRKPDGTMVSKPLEDMFPFLDREEYRKNMIIKPVDE